MDSSEFAYPEWYVKLAKELFSEEEYSSLHTQLDMNFIEAGKQIARRYERMFTTGPSFESLEEMAIRVEHDPAKLGGSILGMLSFRRHLKQLHEWWYEELAERASRNPNLS
jgi:hypothetical protein